MPQLPFSRVQLTPAGLLFTLAYLLLLPAGLSATDWHVDGSVSSSGSGSEASPFKTIQEAADVAVAGDTVHVHAGTYRETVVPANSGTSGNPITYKPWQSDRVILSGADLVSGSWSSGGPNGSWYIDGVSPFNKAHGSTLNQDTQVFVNGQMMILAQIPNDTDLDPLTPDVILMDTRDSASSWPGGNRVQFRCYDSAFAGQANDALNGAKVRIMPYAWWYWRTGEVVDSGDGWVDLWYDFESANHLSYGQDGDPLVVRGHLALLDAEGEWFLDEATDRLYLKPVGGGSPAALTVEVKARDYAFDLSNRAYITVDGFEIFGATVTTDTGAGDGEYLQRLGPWNSGTNRFDPDIAPANNILLDNLDAKYVSHFTLIDAQHFTQWVSSSGFILSGSNITLQNSRIEWSSGNGVCLQGQYNKVLNCHIENVAYEADDSANIHCGFEHVTHSDLEIGHNTLKRSGRGNIIGRAIEYSRIHHNDMSESCLLTTDGAAFYTWGMSRDAHVEIDHNYIHNHHNPTFLVSGLGVFGIYLDNADTSNGRKAYWHIHHNIVAGTDSGYIPNGAVIESRIHNNTFVDNYLSHIGAASAGTRWRMDVIHNIFQGAVDPGRGDVWVPQWPWFPQEQNIDGATDAMLVDSANGDFRLQAGSPAASVSNVTTEYPTPYTAGYAGAQAPGSNSLVDEVGSTLSQLSGYDVWVAGYSLGGFDARADDPDGDGLPNILEYALAKDPAQVDVAYTLTESGGQLTLHFSRNSERTDVSIQVWESSDLSNWSLIAESVAGAALAPRGAASAGHITDPDTTGENAVETRSTLNVSVGANCYLRLQAVY